MEIKMSNQTATTSPIRWQAMQVLSVPPQNSTCDFEACLSNPPATPRNRRFGPLIISSMHRINGSSRGGPV